MTLKDNLKGLVLAGGKSKRMGQDKGLMQWHDQPQREYLAGLLSHFCREVFISCREDQAGEINNYPVIFDNPEYSGPVAGILSAFGEDPSAAWLVVACDLPLIDAETLDYLVSHRDERAIATTFISPHDGLPEPLISIWEPSSFPVLLKKVNEGINCPRKTLIRLEGSVKLLTPPDRNALLNANTPEDAEKVKALLNERAYE